MTKTVCDGCRAEMPSRSSVNRKLQVAFNSYPVDKEALVDCSPWLHVDTPSEMHYCPRCWNKMTAALEDVKK